MHKKEKLRRRYSTSDSSDYSSTHVASTSKKRIKLKKIAKRTRQGSGDAQQNIVSNNNPNTSSNNENENQPKAFTFLNKSLIEPSLSCKICDKYLNIFPIMYSEDIGNICGRCNTKSTLTNLGTITRQKALENLIKNLAFPCINRNNGCPQVLLAEKVEKHENNCSFQPVHCPLFFQKLFADQRCLWTGNSKLLYEHLRTHKDKFLDPPQFEWPSGLENKIFFTTIEKQIITVVINGEKNPINNKSKKKCNKYACIVMMNGSDLESQCWRYLLKMSDEGDGFSLEMKRNHLEVLSKLPDNICCPEKALKIDFDKIHETLQNPKKIFAKFTIIKKNKEEITQIIGNENLGDILSEDNNKQEDIIIPPDVEMLVELECPICNEYMIPPIYICETGHSICSHCKTKMQTCPSCRLPYANGRNFTLEKLTEKVNYPCKYREIGCSFVTTSEKIKQHQNNCELVERHCVFDCRWKGFRGDLYDHLRTIHANKLMQPNTPTLVKIKQSKFRYYFLCVDGQLFQLKLGITAQRADILLIKIMHAGHLEAQPKYKYSIEFTLTSTIGCPNLSITNFCESQGVEKDSNEYMSIPYASVQPYISQNNSCYVKISIIKI